jgi:hypothetical protein
LGSQLPQPQRPTTWGLSASWGCWYLAGGVKMTCNKCLLNRPKKQSHVNANANVKTTDRLLLVFFLGLRCQVPRCPLRLAACGLRLAVAGKRGVRVRVQWTVNTSSDCVLCSMFYVLCSIYTLLDLWDVGCGTVGRHTAQRQAPSSQCPVLSRTVQDTYS